MTVVNQKNLYISRNILPNRQTISLLFLDGETIYGTNTSIDAVSIDAVPIPGAVWLFASGLLGLVGIRRRVKG